MSTASVTAPSKGVFASPWSWVAVVMVMFAVPLARTYALRTRTHPVGVLWQLPSWQLVDQNGERFGAETLRGKIYIANFIFTNCVLECPRLTREMSHLAPLLTHYGDRVHLVSISVDPVNDTPERLRSYMNRYHANPSQWTFVTGPEQTVIDTIAQGFRVGVEVPARNPDGTFNPVDLAHTNRFALVDGRGRLRGTYLADSAGEQQLLDDVATLVSER